MDTLTLESEALKLSPLERVRLADLLLASVETSEVQDRLSRWATEADDRLAAFDRGEIEAIEGESAMSRLRTLVGK